MAYKRFFRKDQKRKLQTGGPADPPDDPLFNILGIAGSKLHETGESIRKNAGNAIRWWSRNVGESFTRNPTNNPYAAEFVKRKRNAKNNVSQSKPVASTSLPNSDISSFDYLNNFQSFSAENKSIPENPLPGSGGDIDQERNNNQSSSSNQLTDTSDIKQADAPDSPKSGTLGNSMTLPIGGSPMDVDTGTPTPSADDLEMASGAPTTMSAGEVATTEQVSSGGSGGGEFGAMDALQFAPEMMNIATGLLSKDTTKDPTKVNNRAVGMMPNRVDVSPQLNQARASYRAILDDSSATTTQKLAAQAQLNKQTSQIMAEKQNRENKLQANKASIQASLDKQQASYDNQARRDRMAADAQLGPTGNIVRQGLAGASQKMLQREAVQNKQDQANKQLAMILSSQPEAVRNRILNALEDYNGQ